MNTENHFVLDITYAGITEKVNLTDNDDICLNDFLKFFPQRRLDVWLKLQSTKEFIEVVNKMLNENYDTTDRWYHKSAIYTIKGKGKKQGTYAHELVALEFLAWLSPEFKVLVFTQWNVWRKQKQPQADNLILSKETFQEMLQTALRNFARKFATKKALEELETEIIAFATHLGEAYFSKIFDRLDALEIKQMKMEGKLYSIAPAQYGYVYLLYNPVNEEYKIGHTTKPQDREKTFKSLDPRIKLHTIHTFESAKQAYLMEKFLHDYFAPKRTHGEWFKLTAEDVAFFKAVKTLSLV